MSPHIIQVDSFTDQAFSGNPAAVCILAHAADKHWMQQVAREMNLSETAFLFRQRDAWNLRWFTPAVEVDLCGHATLASAHVLWQDRHLDPGAQARFNTKSGRLTADRRGGWIEMDFPAEPAVAVEPPEALLPALGITAKYVGKNRMDYLIEVGSETELRTMRPDFARLGSLPVRGVIVTAPAVEDEFDFVSRFFAPGAGVNEDPVTGSAHCCLAPYWGAKLGKTEMTAFQASTRGGIVRVRTAGDRVMLGGQAVTVLRGELIGA